MESVLSQYAWIIPVIPLLAFLVLTAFGRQMKGAAVTLGVFSSFAACVLSILILWERMTGAPDDYTRSFEWFRVGDIRLEFGFDVTNLNALMLVIVTLVSTLVNMYSKAYMEDDERQTVFYAYIALFTGAMLGLVLSPNLIQLYIFWELVGGCSFLLIGFWYERPAARAAAKKAFIVTRIGDVGLLVAILILFWHMPNHALDFTMIGNVFANADSMAQHGISAGLGTWLAALIFLGAVGKSGQFPLHTWLPDAMEGPTPISALIHAATMVAAGVYLVARTFAIFSLSPTAMMIVAGVGGFTAIFAASIAAAQWDMKRILAYSTVSQLGYMMMALGLGAVTAGIFHLFTHAFFKALLFLGAGSVIHAIHTQDIFRMGGLGNRMKVTAWTFAIGALALSGIPPLSGFWSKDAILGAAWEQNMLLFIVGAVTVFITAFYMARLFFLVFTGSAAADSDAESVREAPASMTFPLVVLAVLAAVAGFVHTPFSGAFGTWLNADEPGSSVHAAAMIISVLAGVLGIGLGYIWYGPRGSRRGGTREAANPFYRLVANKYYIDELYEIVFVRSLAGLGRILQAFDTWIVAGIVRLVSGTAIGIGKTGTRLQNGQLQTYGLMSLFGFAALIVFILALGRRFW
ncbi:MAG: NADH-quinone oxidoreductase subunit L [Paenibacillus dendritiformis]|uniref:NADH-quinone oxidoreductase subunit L n=1 Tax=uncultured Paenibacillus sp. TaxID=227322 RepID=UPI0025CFF4A9|nr:NADH-quinone oxidoreductase subunit L [uncultured Paenibacillus sp.]MDU5141497.1 NADH-quinone oxidoreductase subunit L [Paenibacillus dendritiformis]